MRMLRIIILLLLVNITVQGFAQKPRKSTYTKHRYNKNATKVPRSKAGIICPGVNITGYPYQAIGVKLGDPFALTYKVYPNKNFSVGLDFGKSSSGLYNRYYRTQFDAISQPDTLSGGAELAYLTHAVQSDWVAELKFAYLINMEKLSPGLQFYIGAGMEWRDTRITYAYSYLPFPNADGEIDEKKWNAVTQGITGVIGVEYAYFNLPISAFIELELYNDIRADPGWRHTQGGIGIRFVF